jgi:hypothetical protein
MKTYIVWNAYKISEYTGTACPSTYAGLRTAEQATDSSWSSVINTDDIGQFVTAVQNEFDGTLCYIDATHVRIINELDSTLTTLDMLAKTYGTDALVDVLGRSYGALTDDIVNLRTYVMQGGSDE